MERCWNFSNIWVVSSHFLLKTRILKMANKIFLKKWLFEGELQKRGLSLTWKLASFSPQKWNRLSFLNSWGAYNTRNKNVLQLEIRLLFGSWRGVSDRFSLCRPYECWDFMVKSVGFEGHKKQFFFTENILSLIWYGFYIAVLYWSWFWNTLWRVNFFIWSWVFFLDLVKFH